MHHSKKDDPLLQEDLSVAFRPGEMLMYVIYKQGAFGQGIQGLTHDPDIAEELATKAAARDIDDYHSYDVYAVPLGRLPDKSDTPMRDYGWMNREPIFSVSKTCEPTESKKSKLKKAS